MKYLKTFWLWLVIQYEKRIVIKSEILDTHRLYGKFLVKYPDGKFSQKFDFRTAKDYSEIFGGEVLSFRDYNKEEIK